MGYGIRIPKKKVSQGWSNDQAVHDVVNGLVMEFLDMLGDGEAGPTNGVQDRNLFFLEHNALIGLLEPLRLQYGQVQMKRLQSLLRPALISQHGYPGD